jgi:hypothetical protein
MISNHFLSRTTFFQSPFLCPSTRYSLQVRTYSGGENHFQEPLRADQIHHEGHRRRDERDGDEGDVPDSVDASRVQIVHENEHVDREKPQFTYQR